MARAKFIDFRFSIPVTAFTKLEGTFTSSVIGEIGIQGRARIDGEKVGDLPAAFASSADWVDITFAAIHYDSGNILPLLQAIPSGKPMLEMITSQARAHVKTIYDQENF